MVIHKVYNVDYFIIFMKVLFICNQNLNRSKTAEHLFKKEFETKSAGLYNEKPVSKKELLWADIIFVMEDIQINELAKRFPDIYLKKQIISLDIEDVYLYNQPQLIRELKRKVNSILTTHKIAS